LAIPIVYVPDDRKKRGFTTPFLFVVCSKVLNLKINKMDTFLRITLAELQRGAYFNFLMTIYTLAMANKQVAQKADKVLAALHIAITHVDDALAIQRKSEYTKQISQLNQQRLSLLGAMKRVVNSLHKLEATAADAEILIQLFKDYGISWSMQLDQLTGLFANLIDDLEGKAASSVKALGVKYLVTDLKQAQQELQRLSKERMDEHAENGIGRLKEARAEADKAYRNFIKLVEALVQVEGVELYAEFINRVNTEIKHYKQQALGEKVTQKIPGGDGNQNGGNDNNDGEEEPPQG
jgi:hypothetical protein